MNKVEIVLNSLKAHLNLKSYRELADFFQLPKTTVYGWVRNKNISDTGCILAKLKYINLSWLETSEGPMVIIDETNRHLIPQGKYPSEPGAFVYPEISKINQNIRGEVRQQGVKSLSLKTSVLSPRSSNPLNEEPDQTKYQQSDLLLMTSKVLDSETIHRAALTSNIRAFYQAVIQEAEMKSLTEQLESMQAQMVRMETMLASLNAALPQKREDSEGDIAGTPGELSAG